MKFIIIRTFLISSMLLTLCSCQTIESRGQYVDDNLLDTLKEKRFNKSKVEDLIGTPTIIPDYTPNTWYYVQRSLARRAWFEPKVMEQKIVKITFNKKNVIEEVLVLSDSHKDDITIMGEYTKTYGTELNGLQKFVKNIGRFNKTTEGKKKKNR
ncbi:MULTISPECIES: outer membrane protein assembly factor BamE [unclassified Candidatus Tisiphia]|uniref:outer membrane protein assembly factor BamE n=1 Tax=unclassified Candidatus Tisiphia TaxID=2996318 RepID=UPI00312CB19F